MKKQHLPQEQITGQTDGLVKSTHTGKEKKARFEHNKAGLPVHGKTWQRLSGALDRWHEKEDDTYVNPNPNDYPSL